VDRHDVGTNVFSSFLVLFDFSDHVMNHASSGGSYKLVAIVCHMFLSLPSWCPPSSSLHLGVGLRRSNRCARSGRAMKCLFLLFFLYLLPRSLFSKPLPRPFPPSLLFFSIRWVGRTSARTRAVGPSFSLLLLNVFLFFSLLSSSRKCRAPIEGLVEQFSILFLFSSVFSLFFFFFFLHWRHVRHTSELDRWRSCLSSLCLFFFSFRVSFSPPFFPSEAASERAPEGDRPFPLFILS